MSVSIDAIAFKRRVELLQKALPSFGVDSLATVLGKGDTETQGAITSVLHIWLLGYPFANTAIVIGTERVSITTSAKQAKHLDALASDNVGIFVRPKEAQESASVFKEQLQITATGTVGIFSDKPESPIATIWLQVFAEITDSTKDVSHDFSTLLNAKDGEEIALVQMASKASRGVMTQVFADQMTTIIDEGRKVTHTELSQKINSVIDNEKTLRKLKLGPTFESSFLDWNHSTLIKSGSFDFSSPIDDERIKAGVIYCEIGLKYKFYSSDIGRTYLIDPTKDQEEKYTTLYGLQKCVLEAIKAGAKCKDVYEAGRKFVEEKDESLLSTLPSSFGYSIGISKEDGLDISADSEGTFNHNETLVVRVQFENIPSETESYSLGLVDTVQVTHDEVIVFTDSPRSRSDIAFSLQTEEKPARAPPRQLRIDPREKSNQLLASHQIELKRQLQERGLQKYSGTEAVDNEEVIEFKKYESYKREQQLPQLKDLRIALDSAAQTVIVPVNGRPVPFHINTFKNGSKTEEGDHVYLRLNFNSPDTALGKTEMPFENPSATFIKSLTIRSKNIERINDVFKRITDMKRDAVRREAERRQLKDVVQQDKLIEVRDRRPLRLDPVFVRPMPEGKRAAGFLEIHKNGVRYQSPMGRDQKVEVLFSNVDKIFFQPSVSELVVLIHFHLKAPIMVGKRKTMDVQFYRDATDVAYDDTGNRKRRYRYGDEDEIEQEQEERRIRKALDKEFKLFAEQIAKASEKLEVDIPFRELGFYGVPSRSNVFIQPTTDCLVQLVDTPFLVIKLDEIELAHLERIQFGLREFDLVFIYKDYTKAPTHINTIPIGQVEAVKDWLNEMDIPFYEGPLNLNWSVIMKTIAGNPSDFYHNDGWGFLNLEDDNEEVVEEESEFEAEEDPGSESDFDEDEEDISAESEIETDEEDSGPEWDELEEEAAREDEMAERDSDDDVRAAPRGRRSKGRR